MNRWFAFLSAGALLVGFARIAPAGNENQELKTDIGGQYRIMGNSANFGWHPDTIGSDEETRSFFNQRFRTWLDVRANENIAGYLQVEIGHVMWGADDEFPKTYAVGDDKVGVELRRGYLTYANQSVGAFKVGIQDWSDAFGDVLASPDHDFNVGGVSVTRKLEAIGNAEIKLGGFIIRDNDVSSTDETTLWAMDATLQIAEEGSLGLSVYYLNDKGDYSYGTFGGPLSTNGVSFSDDLWVGVRGDIPVGAASLNAFFIYNTGGTKSPDWDHSGFAAGIKSSCDVGIGKLGVQALYSTGDDDPTDGDSGEFRTIAQSDRDNFGAFGYWSFLGLTSPRGSSDVQDLGVSLQNRGFGLMTIQSNFEFPLSENVSGYLSGGWLSSAEENSANGNRNMGVEVLAEATVDLGGGLALDVGGAYLFTGNFYEAAGGGDADDVFELFTRLQFGF